MIKRYKDVKYHKLYYIFCINRVSSIWLLQYNAKLIKLEFLWKEILKWYCKTIMLSLNASNYHKLDGNIIKNINNDLDLTYSHKILTSSQDPSFLCVMYFKWRRQALIHKACVCCSWAALGNKLWGTYSYLPSLRKIWLIVKGSIFDYFTCNNINIFYFGGNSVVINLNLDGCFN